MFVYVCYLSGLIEGILGGPPCMGPPRCMNGGRPGGGPGGNWGRPGGGPGGNRTPGGGMPGRIGIMNGGTPDGGPGG